MAQTILLKRSALQGKTPDTGSLQLGEVAINTYDGKAYIKRSGSVESIQEFILTNTLNTGSINLSGSQSITGSLNVSGGITGSLFGTASFAQALIPNATASYSITASFAENFNPSATASYAISASTALTASYFITSSVTSASFAQNALNASTASYFLTGSVTSASYAESSSYAFTATSASFAQNALNASTASYFLTSSVTSASFATSASYADIAISASYAFNATSASYAQNATSASHAPNALTASYAISSSYSYNADLLDGKDSSEFATTGSNIFVGNQTITGSLNITGSTIQIGNNTLLGNTSLSGSITISGSENPTTPTIQIFGDTQHTGVVRFSPISRSINNNISASYIYVSGSTNDLYFTQNGAGYANTTRLRWLEGNLYTGLLNGGILSTVTGSTTFNLSSGSGIIVNLNASLSDNPYPTVQYIDWGNFTNQPLTYLTSSIQTFLGIDSSGQILQQTSPWNDGQYNTSISIGTVLHQNQTTTNGSISYPNVAYGWKQRSYDFVKAFGPLKLSGYYLTPSGSATGSLVVSSGTAWADGRNYQTDPNNPSYITDQGTNVSKIFKYYQSGSGFVQDTNGGLGYLGIDPGYYNPNGSGSLTAVSPSTPWTNQRVFYYPNSVTKAIVVYYGTVEYATETEAINNLPYEPFIETPNTQQNAIYLGTITIKYNGSLQNPNDGKILPGGIFRNVGGSGGGGSVVTSTLAGLSDVQLSGPTNYQPLVYNSTLTKWVNASFISGTLYGNAQTATSASQALTSSYANIATSASYADISISSSYAISASQATTSSYSNIAISASYADNATSASYAFNSTSSSYASTALTASYAVQALTASYAISASHAPNALTASYAISASQAITASYSNDATSASYSNFSTSGSYALNTTSASYAAVSTTSSYADIAISASYAHIATSASFATNALTASYFVTSSVTSASFASTASYVTPLIQNVLLTGSLTSTANIQANKFIFTDGVINESTTSQRMFAAGGGYMYLYTGPNGLYINNQANNANNVTITDAGVVQTRGTLTVGAPGNDQSIYFGGTNAGLYWASSGASIAYSVGALQFNSVGTTNNMVLQQSGGALFNYGITGSLLGTASFANIASSSSYAATSSFANNFTVAGTLTAQTINVQTITSSIDYVTGSTIFGSQLSNTHQFTGSVTITGSLAVNNSNVILTNQTSSMTVLSSSYALTASYFVTSSVTSASFATSASYAQDATNALTASYFITSSVTSASYAESSSYAFIATSASYAQDATNALTASYFVTSSVTSASFATNALSASYAFDATSASYSSIATSASFATNALTASYFVTSSVTSASFATSASYALSSTSASYAATSSYANNFVVGNTLTLQGTLTDYSTVNSSIVGSNNLFTISTGSYRGAFYKYTLYNGTDARSGEVMAVWNEGNVQYTDVSTVDLGSTSAVTASVSIVTAQAQFNFQTNTSGWTIKSTVTYI